MCAGLATAYDVVRVCFSRYDLVITRVFGTVSAFRKA